MISITAVKSPTIVFALVLPCCLQSCNPTNGSEEPTDQGVISVVTLTDTYVDDTLRLYNPEDTSLWHQFSFVYDDSNGEYEFERAKFGPFAFHPDYYMLGLISRKENSAYYLVEVDELGTEKLLGKLPSLRRIPLDEYLSGLGSISLPKPTLGHRLDGQPIELPAGFYTLEAVANGKARVRAVDSSSNDQIFEVEVVQQGLPVLTPLLE